jgi:hypothetical protein
MAYNRLVLGVHPGATEKFDTQWDTPAFFTTLDADHPPVLKAYIDRPDYTDDRRQLWRDIRSEGGGSKREWDLVVDLAPSEIGKTVTVAWNLPPALAASRENVILTDAESNTSIDMRSQSSYEFIHSTSAPRTLSVAVNPPSKSSDRGSSGFLGCGTVGLVRPGPPDAGTTAAGLINMLILLSPVLLRLHRLRKTCTV